MYTLITIAYLLFAFAVVALSPGVATRHCRNFDMASFLWGAVTILFLVVFSGFLYARHFNLLS